MGVAALGNTLSEYLGKPVRLQVEFSDGDDMTPAERALALMEEYSITSLFIVDEVGRPCGILHLHDLLRAGVV